MFKLMGALCILGGCSYLGLKTGDVYRARTEMLSRLQNGLNMLETEIGYSATPLPMALERIGGMMQGEAKVLFARAASSLQAGKGVSAAEAWDEGVRALCLEVPLSREEISILNLFGRGLGSSAREEQLKNIFLAREQLRNAWKAAEEARTKNQRLWQYMGFCAGAVIVLVLI